MLYMVSNIIYLYVQLSFKYLNVNYYRIVLKIKSTIKMLLVVSWQIIDVKDVNCSTRLLFSICVRNKLTQNKVRLLLRDYLNLNI